MGEGERHDRAEPAPSEPGFVEAFARRYAKEFPVRHLALCPVCGATHPMFLRRWMEVGIILHEGKRAPQFHECWGDSMWPRFAWFRW
jgi:hypothetical protein